MSELKCWKCEERFEYTSTGGYPCGPCPKSCPKCEVSCCPECGGELSKPSDSEEIRDYCGDGCVDCGYEHCGGCI